MPQTHIRQPGTRIYDNGWWWLFTERVRGYSDKCSGGQKSQDEASQQFIIPFGTIDSKCREQHGTIINIENTYEVVGKVP